MKTYVKYGKMFRRQIFGIFSVRREIRVLCDKKSSVLNQQRHIQLFSNLFEHCEHVFYDEK